jgi:small-conductance mechanosensitive channel
MKSLMDEIDIWQHVLPIIIIIFCFIAGFIIKLTILKRLSRLAQKSRARLDDVFIESLRSVIVLWFVLLGVYISINILPLSPKESDFMQKVFQALLIFSIFWFLLQLLGKIFFVYSSKLKKKIPAASIFKNTLKIFIFTIGVLIILQTLGISITPILTTLGVGGLAVALALQDTLANLFAGFHIIGTQRVKPRDYIKLDSGEEGYVVDITWRDTVLRQLPNNFVIIPNSRLSSAIVVNFYRPQKTMNVLIEVGIDYTSDLEHVEQVTLEVANEIMREVPGGVKDFNPFIRYHTFGDSSINFTVYLRCQEFFDKFLVQHEFIKRLKKRYDQERINIPFPIRTVIMQKE